MGEFREGLWLLISTPIYLVVIAAEMIYSHLHQKHLYSAKGVMTNVCFTLLNAGLDLILRGTSLFILAYFFRHRFFEIDNRYVYWAVLFVVQDLMFYCLHRVDHVCRFFWAVHVTHHNSEEFNFTVGFRSSVFQPFYRFIYYIPITLMGFHGIDILFMYAITQLYGILLHTQLIGNLGWLEYFFVTPSHHRVHHASNTKYLDKNMGMVLIIWDKLFGTFQAEDKNTPVRFGLTARVDSSNPFVLLFHEWKEMVSDLAKKTSLKNKLLYIFGPPGWSHDGSRKTSAQLQNEFKSKTK